MFRKPDFLNQVKTIPEDLENYVLKPLFSFAGQGVVIDIKPEDLHAVKDPVKLDPAAESKICPGNSNTG